MKYILIGTLGALAALVFFAMGLAVGTAYSMSKQWVSYSLAMQELGTAAETMTALHMLDKTSPEQTREYLTSKLAYQLRGLDIMTKNDASQHDELANGLFLKVAQHKKEHPFAVKYSELEEKLNAILAAAESESQKDK